MTNKLFIVILRYIVPIEVIDAHRPAHVVYLDHHYATGTFLASGAQTPRYGGIIMAQAESYQQLHEILMRDPFAQHQCAEYQLYEFNPTKQSPYFREFMDNVGF